MNNGYEYIIISISLACWAVASIFCAVSAFMRCKQRRRIPRKSSKNRQKLERKLKSDFLDHLRRHPFTFARRLVFVCISAISRREAGFDLPWNMGRERRTVISSYFAGRRFAGRDMLRQSHPCNSAPTITICCGSSWVMENYLQSEMCNGKLDFFSARAVDF